MAAQQDRFQPHPNITASISVSHFEASSPCGLSQFNIGRQSISVNIEFLFYCYQVGKAIKKFFKGWRKRRELRDMRDENFALHIRRRRFISKIICEGLVGGGCSGLNLKLNLLERDYLLIYRHWFTKSFKFKFSQLIFSEGCLPNISFFSETSPGQTHCIVFSQPFSTQVYT